MNIKGHQRYLLVAHWVLDNVTEANNWIFNLSGNTVIKVARVISPPPVAGVRVKFAKFDAIGELWIEF